MNTTILGSLGVAHFWNFVDIFYFVTEHYIGIRFNFKDMELDDLDPLAMMNNTSAISLADEVTEVVYKVKKLLKTGFFR